MALSLLEEWGRGLFTLPGMGERIRGDPPAEPAGGWPEDFDPASLPTLAEEAVRVARPAIRALLLAGHRPLTATFVGLKATADIVVDIGARSSASVGPGSVTGLDPAASVAVSFATVPMLNARSVFEAVYQVDVLGPATDDREPVEPTDVDVAGMSLAADLSGISGDGFELDLGRAEPGSVLIWGTGTGSPPLAVLTESVAAFVHPVIARLASIYQAAAPLAPGGTGLLWLFDPSTWWSPDWTSADPQRERGKRALTRVGNRGLTGIGTELSHANFITGQVDGTGLVSGVLTGWFPKASARNLSRKAGRMLPVDDTITPELVDSWSDQCWLDHLLSWARWGVIQPPALPQADVDIGAGAGDIDEIGDWVTAVMNADRSQVALAVTGDSELVAWLINRWHGVQTIEDAVCWELIRKDDDKDELLVVAAPGVQISVPQDPNPWWEWTIVRVQDPALVPNWGERIMLDVLLAPFPIALEPRPDFELVAEQQAPPDLDPDNPTPTPVDPVVMVFPSPTGCRMEYPVYENGARAGDPYFVAELTVSETSGVDRYAIDALMGLTFDFGYDATVSRPRITIVSIWASSDEVVDITYAVPTFRFCQYHCRLTPDSTEMPRFGESHPVPQSDLVWPWEENPGGVPLTMHLPAGVMAPDGSITQQDVNQITDAMWGDAIWGQYWTTSKAKPGTTVNGEWMQMVADFAVGLIPWVGDAVDVAEFGYAMFSGKDRWGRPLTNFDLVVLGACAALPFVSTGMVKGLAMARRMSVDEIVTDAARAPFVAHGGDDFWETMAKLVVNPSRPGTEEAIDAARAGSRRLQQLPIAERRQVIRSMRVVLEQCSEEIASKVTSRTLALGDLLKNDNEFWVAPLQWHYQRWRRARITAAEKAGASIPTDISPADYWQASRGRPRAMFDSLLGLTPTEQAALAKKNALGSSKWGPVPTVTRAGGVRAAFLVGRVGDILAAVPVQHRQRIEALLARLSPDGTAAGIDAAGLRKLMGDNATLHPDELGARLAGALEIMVDEAAQAGANVDDLLALNRVEGIFKEIVVLSGPGYRQQAAEIFVIAKALADGDVIRIQEDLLTAAGTVAKGPDVIRSAGGVPQIVQVTAQVSVDAILGSGNKVMKQFTDDLRRVYDQFGGLRLPSFDDPTVIVDASTEIVFKVDFDYLLLNSRKTADDLEDQWVEDAFVLQQHLEDYIAAMDLPGPALTVVVEAFRRTDP